MGKSVTLSSKFLQNLDDSLNSGGTVLIGTDYREGYTNLFYRPIGSNGSVILVTITEGSEIIKGCFL